MRARDITHPPMALLPIPPSFSVGSHPVLPFSFFSSADKKIQVRSQVRAVGVPGREVRRKTLFLVNGGHFLMNSCGDLMCGLRCSSFFLAGPRGRNRGEVAAAAPTAAGTERQRGKG